MVVAPFISSGHDYDLINFFITVQSVQAMAWYRTVDKQLLQIMMARLTAAPLYLNELKHFQTSWSCGLLNVEIHFKLLLLFYCKKTYFIVLVKEPGNNIITPFGQKKSINCFVRNILAVLFVVNTLFLDHSYLFYGPLVKLGRQHTIFACVEMAVDLFTLCCLFIQIGLDLFFDK